MKVEFCPDNPNRWTIRSGIYDIVRIEDILNYSRIIYVRGLTARDGFPYPINLFKPIFTEEDYEDAI